MSTHPFTITGRFDRQATEPFEVGTVQWIRRPGAGGREQLSSGFWFVSPEDAPGPMEVIGHADETVYILEGRIRVQPADGDAVELSAGSVASFDKDASVTWTVLEPTVEFFVYS